MAETSDTGLADPTLAADAGQAAASAASSLVANAGAVLFLLPGSSAAERVVLGEGGVLGACRQGRVGDAGASETTLASAMSPS